MLRLTLHAAPAACTQQPGLWHFGRVLLLPCCLPLRFTCVSPTAALNAPISLWLLCSLFSNCQFSSPGKPQGTTCTLHITNVLWYTPTPSPLLHRSHAWVPVFEAVVGDLLRWSLGPWGGEGGGRCFTVRMFVTNFPCFSPVGRDPTTTALGNCAQDTMGTTVVHLLNAQC